MTTEQKLLLRGVLIKGQFYDPATVKPAIESTVGFVPDPENQHDPMAVKCFSPYHNNAPVGFLQKEVSPVVLLFLSGGYTVTGVVTGVAKNGNVAVDVWAAKP